jgi:hypothetical protein
VSPDGIKVEKQLTNYSGTSPLMFEIKRNILENSTAKKLNMKAYVNTMR